MGECKKVLEECKKVTEGCGEEHFYMLYDSKRVRVEVSVRSDILPYQFSSPFPSEVSGVQVVEERYMVFQYTAVITSIAL